LADLKVELTLFRQDGRQRSDGLREGWIGRDGTMAAFATPLARAPAPFGHKPPPFSLLVDLRRDMGSRRWWRGLGTLAALTGALVATAPGLEPLPVPDAPPLEAEPALEWRVAGADQLGAAHRTTLRMAADARVEPIAQAPERATVDLFLTLGPDGLAPALARVGATFGDAGRAQQLVRAAAPRLKPGTAVSVRLGKRDATGRRPLESLSLRSALDMKLAVQRGPTGLVLARIPLKVDVRPIRVRGRAGDGLYWAMRTAGVSAPMAADYLKAINAELDVGEIAADDTFDLVLNARRTADGQSADGMLLYAGLSRLDGTKVQLVRWTAGGKPIWVNAATIGRPSAQAGGFQWPVAARITSGFGYRIHPILRFARLHRGIDFGAAWGTPIRAAADGQVTRAGWAGGYGRQVRLAHGGGMATSYSHMSSLAVAPGTHVTQGQVIGYVGSSGLSTGPHLHYEVYRDGAAVNPMGVRFTSVQVADTTAVDAIKKRLAALMKVGTRG
jgi:murein DD-endopeptidase MepM/ murein hydrolase activator NlpD